jgi:hypothetical protein
MKSCVWYTYLCVVLVLVASPTIFADTYAVEDGGGDSYGGGSGWGWGTSAEASATASGSNPFVTGYGSGSLDVYTTEAGSFICWSACDACGYCTADNADGSVGWGAAGGSGDAPCGSAYVSIGLTYSSVGSGENGLYDPGYEDYYVDYLDAFECVSSSCAAAAAAGTITGSSSGGSGEGNGYAEVSLY